MKLKMSLATLALGVAVSTAGFSREGGKSIAPRPSETKGGAVKTTTTTEGVRIKDNLKDRGISVKGSETRATDVGGMGTTAGGRAVSDFSVNKDSSKQLRLDGSSSEAGDAKLGDQDVAVRLDLLTLSDNPELSALATARGTFRDNVQQVPEELSLLDKKLFGPATDWESPEAIRNLAGTVKAATEVGSERGGRGEPLETYQQGVIRFGGKELLEKVRESCKI